MTDIYSAPVQFLKGVGEKRAHLYEKMGVRTVRDLFYYFPRSYLDFSNPVPITQTALQEYCTVRAQVIFKSKEQKIRFGLSIHKVKIADDSGEVNVTFFNGKYAVDPLQVGETYLFYGKMSGNLLHREMNSPIIKKADEACKFLSVYPLTNGMSSKMISSNIHQAFSSYLDCLRDPLPEKLREEKNLCSLSEAIRNIHFPENTEVLEKARRRIIFEEFLSLSLSLGRVRKKNKASTAYPMQQKDLSLFFDSLSFSPTGAQRRVIGEICDDMQRQTPMNRLVEGDVGSGKTLVAAAACYFAFLNGFQSAMMAPTEILAAQHYKTLSGLLSGLGMKIELLTGSVSEAEKRSLKERLARGEIDLCVGTHAMLTEDVEYQNLSLVITDEQHRFGVAQRAELAKKGNHPHMLVMSATPIPRTLALMIYGDLELSVIDEMPPNRRKVETYRIDSGKRERAYNFIIKHVQEGRQVYIICPLVEQSDGDPSVKSAVEYAKELSEGGLSGCKIGVLHGRMKSSEKELVMRRFQAGDIQVLVSTTVVEVGVDVPNASIILVENAERFGLSQLHQLRGRVGRGEHQSYCILLTDIKNPDTLDRLDALCKNADGFSVAEYDLQMRGPGDFLGERQHGLPQMRMASMAHDMALLEEARQTASEILRIDPDLSLPENSELRRWTDELIKMSAETLN